jgi:formate hydrogenlyase transcriptional activator
MAMTDLDGVLPQHSPLEEQLHATLNILPAHAWYALPNGALTFVNERAADYLGLPKDDPLRFGTDTGAEWDSHIPLLHPDDQEETRRVWSHCVQTGSAGDMSFRVRNAERGYRWFLSRAEPVRAANGSLLLWVGVNLDIEERKQAELELRRSKAHLADMQRLSRTGCVGMEGRTKRIFWSDEAARIYGYPPGTVPTPELILQRAHPDDVGLVKDALERAAQGASDFDYEHRLLMPDGSIKHLHDVAHSCRDEAGNVEVIGAIIDITERKATEERIRAQEAELRQMLDFAPQFIGVYGPNRERLYANRGALEYAGLSLDEWRRTEARGAFIHPDDREQELAYFARAQSDGSPGQLEVRLRAGDGSYRWFLARYNSVRDSNGQILRWHVSLTDIEDRKQAEERLQRENVALREEIDKASMFEEIVGTSPALQTVLSLISKVAPTDSTVLLTGETGTGKELVARAIHRRSPRASRPFVSVNCAAIPRDLIASELFGHEKGAFTGALQRRIGRFELAEGGTIFLDEVGELLPDTQVALLRVLQEREFERVGGSQTVRLDVRVIAATNRNLMTAVATGAFREDLYYRLSVFPLEMPPLRARRADIRLLVEYFIDRYARKAGKTFRSVDKRTLELLQSYPWPGNIRELQNVIERSVILGETEIFTVDESWLSQRPHDNRSGDQPFLTDKVAAAEREIIEAALRESRGRVFGPSGAAASLGIARSTLESKIRALNIDKNRFKTPSGA